MVKPGGGEKEDVFAFKHIKSKLPVEYLGDIVITYLVKWKWSSGMGLGCRQTCGCHEHLGSN